jgi:hypothetical protein
MLLPMREPKSVPFLLYLREWNIMSKKITNKMITDRFIAAFEKGKPFTPSEKRMMGIKLAQLKKSIIAHLESTGRQTELSVEQIIMDGVEYGIMINAPWRSIASVGYNTLDPSLDYWEKRRKMEVMNKATQIEEAQNFIDQTNNSNQQHEPVSRPERTTNAPAWLNNSGW